METRLQRFALGCAAIAVMATPMSAAAKSASDLRDLLGARASGGERDLEGRGWVSITGHRGGNASYSYWWSASRKDCVMVRTIDGRFDSITDASNGDCNQKGGSSDAAVAVGAVGAIALIAGHNDGMYNQPYHNYSRSDSYSSGYQSGVQQRGHNTSYRDNHRWGAGYAPSVDVSDLNGARSAGAESDLQSRGFRSVDGFQSGGNGKGAIWWNGRTRQCLQVITVNGYVDSLSDIGNHRRCR